MSSVVIRTIKRQLKKCRLVLRFGKHGQPSSCSTSSNSGHDDSNHSQSQQIAFHGLDMMLSLSFFLQVEAFARPELSNRKLLGCLRCGWKTVTAA